MTALVIDAVNLAARLGSPRTLVIMLWTPRVWIAWEKDFDEMAYKTMLRQIISKWGILSVEMRQAFESDDAIIGTDGVAVPVSDVESAKDITPPEATEDSPEAPAETSDSAEQVSLDSL